MTKHLSMSSSRRNPPSPYAHAGPYDRSGPAIPIIAPVELASGSTHQIGASSDGAVRPVLHAGARGAAVEDLQDRLVELGAVLAVDGVFGPDTRAAVTRLQEREGLEPDGIVGPLLWSVLDAAPGPSPAELALDDALAL